MNRFVPVLAALALLSACSGSPTASSSASPQPSASTTTNNVPLPGQSPSPATTADHFIIDGVPSKNSGVSAITSFARGNIGVNFGFGFLVLPADYTLNVVMKFSGYPAVDSTYGTEAISSATITLGTMTNNQAATAVWKPGTTDGSTLTLAVSGEKVSVTYKGKVAGADKTYDVDAVMTNQAPRFTPKSL